MLNAQIPLQAQGMELEPRSNLLMRAMQMQGAQQANALRQMQMQQMQQAAQDAIKQREAEAARQREIDGYLASLSGAAGPPQPFNPVEALRKTGDQKMVEFLSQAPNMGRAKVSKWQEFAGPGGAPMVQAFDEFGKPIGEPMAKAVALKFINTGAAQVPVNEYTGKPQGDGMKVSMSPAERDASARGWANVNLGKERLEFDKTKPKPDAAKPLPTAALKMQQEALDAIGVVGGINADLKALENQIDAGKLEFGPVSNAKNIALNMAGMSTQQSRNFATFKSNMERLRNESLRLNTGVQTDGDAQRAWNELFQNITDTKLVKQRLQEIQRINARGAELQKLKLDQVRMNYGHEPLDVTPQTTQQPALKGEVSSPLSPAEQAELEQLRKRFGK